jgi:hypothetical protein
VIGGPAALWLVTRFQPELLETAIGDSELWEGLATIAGSWIGGGANQTAMKEIFEVQETLFASTVVVDILVGNIWMAFLLIGAGQAARVDRWLKADSGSIDQLITRVETFQKKVARIPTLTDYMVIAGVAFAAVAISHFGSDLITPWMEARSEWLAARNLHSLTKGFFWIVVIATTLGLLLALTPLRKLEGAGASKFGSMFIYILVATIGMKMSILDAINNPSLVPDRRDLDAGAYRHLATRSKTDQGAVFLRRRGQPGQCRGSSLGPDCGFSFQSGACARGRGAGGAWLCAGDLWGYFVRAADEYGELAGSQNA